MKTALALFALIKTELHLYLDHHSQAATDNYIDLDMPKQLHQHLSNCSEQLRDLCWFLRLLPPCPCTELPSTAATHTPTTHTTPEHWKGSPGGLSTAAWPGVRLPRKGIMKKWAGWGYVSSSSISLRSYARWRTGSNTVILPSIPLPLCAVTVSIAEDRARRWRVTVGQPY